MSQFSGLQSYLGCRTGRISWLRVLIDKTLFRHVPSRQPYIIQDSSNSTPNRRYQLAGRKSKLDSSSCLLEMPEFEKSDNIGALIIRTGFWGPLNYNYIKELPK